MKDSRFSSLRQTVDGARRRLRTTLKKHPVETWDLDGAIRRNIAAISVLGITLGTFISRKFFVLPVAAALVVLEDAVMAAARRKPRRVS
jgi:hypothetical protein